MLTRSARSRSGGRYAELGAAVDAAEAAGRTHVDVQLNPGVMEVCCSAFPPPEFEPRREKRKNSAHCGPRSVCGARSPVRGVVIFLPPPLPSRTNRTRRVPHPVLIGHAASAGHPLAAGHRVGAV
jgi:hypothetical protein